jgi:hypothetical protein
MTEETSTEDMEIISKETRTARFAQWLMDREAKRQDKESNVEGLIRFNIFLSTITIVGLFGSSALNYALMAYAWL